MIHLTEHVKQRYAERVAKVKKEDIDRYIEDNDLHISVHLWSMYSKRKSVYKHFLSNPETNRTGNIYIYEGTFRDIVFITSHGDHDLVTLWCLYYDNNQDYKVQAYIQTIRRNQDSMDAYKAKKRKLTEEIQRIRYAMEQLSEILSLRKDDIVRKKLEELEVLVDEKIKEAGNYLQKRKMLRDENRELVKRIMHNKVI